MSTPSDDELRRLLHEAVDDLEPADRIAAIRERTAASAPGPWRRRTAIGGAVLATAAAVTAVAVLPQVLDDDDPAAPAGTVAPSASRAPSGDSTVGTPTDPQSVPAYFIGEGPRGDRLFREFVVTDGSSPRLLAALRALESTPSDPDYRTAWSPDSFLDATYSDEEGLITVELAGSVEYSGSYESLGSSAESLAVQQAVYTAQGAVGQGRVPVQFQTADGGTGSGVEVPTDDPVTNAPVLDTLSLMSISYPFEGAEVEDSFTATGVNNSFEATVVWRLEDETGESVRQGFSTAEGWGEERLFPWETEVDVSGLAPGAYTFVATNDDPSGGTEATGPDSDTRLVLIE